MRLSFLGKSYNISRPTFESFKTGEAVSVKGQSHAHDSFQTAHRQQPTTLTYRSAATRNQAIQRSTTPKRYKTVAVEWIDVNHAPTSMPSSGAKTAQSTPSESREIEIKLPKMDAMTKLLLFIQAEETGETAGSQVYESRVVKIDKAAKTALVQVSRLGESTDWTAKLKTKMVLVNSIAC